MLPLDNLVDRRSASADADLSELGFHLAQAPRLTLIDRLIPAVAVPNPNPEFNLESWSRCTRGVEAVIERLKVIDRRPLLLRQDPLGNPAKITVCRRAALASRRQTAVTVVVSAVQLKVKTILDPVSLLFKLDHIFVRAHFVHKCREARPSLAVVRLPCVFLSFAYPLTAVGARVAPIPVMDERRRKCASWG